MPIHILALIALKTVMQRIADAAQKLADITARGSSDVSDLARQKEINFYVNCAIKRSKQHGIAKQSPADR